MILAVFSNRCVVLGAAVALFGCLWNSNAGAATFRIVPGNGTTPTVVTVAGFISPEDGDEFVRRTGGLDFAVVVLDGPGGSVVAGLEIGTAIRNRGFFTGVKNGARCVSACAFAWLGGAKRYMGKSSLVGFHGAFVIRDGRALTSGAWNDLVKAYMDRLGFGGQTASILTREAPNSIRWLTRDSANRLGIPVETFPDSAGAPRPRAVSKKPGVKTQNQKNCLTFEGRCS